LYVITIKYKAMVAIKSLLFSQRETPKKKALYNPEELYVRATICIYIYKLRPYAKVD